MSEKHYLDELNPIQRAAVEATEGPVMIIAGAGSGKTRVLTYRLAHLLALGNDPFRVMSLTFTNKAAAEMRSRVEKLIGGHARQVWMGTFHSVFARLLRMEAKHLGFPSNFTIYDTDDAKSLLKAVIKEANLDAELYKPGIVYNRISSAKNALIGPGQYNLDTDIQAEDLMNNRPRIGEIYKAYAARCFKAGAMDFDDLILQTYTLLTKFPEVLHKYQHRFKYLMVDEYQDTNYAQYRIVKLLAAVHHNLCVVGDDAQSIYAFRGADIQNILSFESDYPDHKVFKLEQNYRSTKMIVEVAGKIIANNEKQFKKNLWTDNDAGLRVRLIRAGSEGEEARTVASAIHEEKLRNRRRNREFAILYRTNAQSRHFEEALRRLNIPYRVYGGQSFYQRKEVKDLLAYLRLIVNPGDEEAFKRIINTPARGIGQVSVQKLQVIANDQGISLLEASEAAPVMGFGAGSNKVEAFFYMIKAFQADAEKMDAYTLAVAVAKKTGLMADLAADKSPEGVSRAENLQELLNGIKQWVDDPQVDQLLDNPLDNPIDNPLGLAEVSQDPDQNPDILAEGPTLGAYLQNVSLMTGNENVGPDADEVFLMTVHAAKGLEFPFVFIGGLEEGLFPNQMSSLSKEDLEEERRLFYVAVTRAEHQLTVSYATSRMRQGQLNYQEMSRFIQEIGAESLEDKSPVVSAPARSSFESGGGYRGGAGGGTGVGQALPLKPKVVAVPTVEHKPSEGFAPSDTSNLSPGQKVEHLKFGYGVVESTDGVSPDRRANIHFELVGLKNIVLRFAKLRIVE